MANLSPYKSIWTTWQVLRDVDRLMANSPGWQKGVWDNDTRRTDYCVESTFRDKRFKQRVREARKRRQ